MGRFTQSKKTGLNKTQPTARKSTCHRPVATPKTTVVKSPNIIKGGVLSVSKIREVKKLKKPDATTIKKLRRRYRYVKKLIKNCRLKVTIYFKPCRPSFIEMREIQRCQRATETLIPRLPFQRLVREIVREMKIAFRFQAAALSALHVKIN